MPQLLLGIATLAIVLWGLNGFSKIDPKKLAPWVRRAGGVGALALAAFLGMRGQLAIALPIEIAGLGMLGYSPFGMAGFGQRTQKTSGQVSRVRSNFIEMELDHDSGAMRGRFVAGRHQGVEFTALSVAALTAALVEMDEESRALLMAYLDRREPRWRENAHAGADTREARAPQSGKMAEEEAYQILSLQPGATADEIGRAHRALMKKLHPDQGGSTYLAARVNEAKEVLLRRHR